MSKGGKQKSSGSPEEHRPSTTPRALFPTVTRVPEEDFKLTDSQFKELEKAGNVTLSEKQRTDLLTLAIFWIDDLRLRRSARPKQFRERLEKMEKAFTQAEEASRWDGTPERHLAHWAMEQPVKDAMGFPIALAALENQLQTIRATVVALMQCLPPDPGRQRPFDDERRIIFLADVFEQAGAKAVVYADAYSEKGSMADTAFRRFAQRFYSLLPSDDRRDPGGLDDALRDALAARRAQRRGS
jgi:hypothetical protein